MEPTAEPDLPESVKEFLDILKEFGVQYKHDPKYQEIYIESKVSYTQLHEVPQISVYQGNVKIIYTKYAKTKSLNVVKGDSIRQIIPFECEEAWYSYPHFIVKY